jgi:HEPN superfamily RiboL-PSP-like protein
MPTRGASEVNRLRSSLKDAFSRARSLRNDDAEIQSDLARYLCVLVSGFVEIAVAELAIEHCRSRSATSVLSYASAQLDRLQNVKAQKLVQIVGSFEKRWSTELSNFMEGGRKDALDSVVNLRNKIAHGESVSLSLGRMIQYFEKIDEIVVFVEALLK